MSSLRASRIAALGSELFDVLVIGGGITGCGVARDAALRGLRVALVERDDFASGTSSRSSRLIHGGLRYLEHGQLHLVAESSAERRRLLRVAPHLVRPMAFVWPVYSGARVSRWKLRAALTLYDLLAVFRNAGTHRQLTSEEVRTVEPALRVSGLEGGARYFDAATDDSRLTLVNALGAEDGGAIVVNHVEARSLTIVESTVRGARVVDALSGVSIDVRARVVVNATGPWSHDIRLMEERGRPSAVRGSKGVHIAVPRERVGNRGALTLLSPRDGRVMFVLPAGDQTIVGTTDSYTSARPDNVRATTADIDYLLTCVNNFFPDAKLRAYDVVCAWAGIRPLIASTNENPEAASREHVVSCSPAGVVAVTGGKLTTYRVMAADVVDTVLRQLGRPRARSPTLDDPLPGGDLGPLRAETAEVERTVADAQIGRHLMSSYGSDWRRVWTAIDSSPAWAQRLVPTLPYTFGEIRYGVTDEMACTIADLLIRRTHLAFETRDHGLDVAPAVARVVAPLLGWAAGDLAGQIESYRTDVNRIFVIDPA